MEEVLGNQQIPEHPELELERKQEIDFNTPTALDHIYGEVIKQEPGSWTRFRRRSSRPATGPRRGAPRESHQR